MKPKRRAFLLAILLIIVLMAVTVLIAFADIIFVKAPTGLHIKAETIYTGDRLMTAAMVKAAERKRDGIGRIK